MRKVQELQEQIQKLSPEEFTELRDWFQEQDWNAWDAQIEADAKSGKLDKLLIETSERRYRELADGKVEGVPGPLVFDRLRAQGPLTAEERAELDRALDAYEADGKSGRLAEDVIEGIKKKL